MVSKEYVKNTKLFALLIILNLTFAPFIIRADNETEKNSNLFFETPQLNLKEFSQAPTIDGVLNDPCWNNADETIKFREYITGKDPIVQTEVKGGFDGKNLYFAFICKEPADISSNTPWIAKDSTGVFSTDHIEIFLKTEAFSDRYYHFAVSNSGIIYEATKNDCGWSPKWQAAVNISENCWIVEVAIPKNIINATTTHFLSANFCRGRYKSSPETTCWAPTFGANGGFHNSSRFGSIVLGEKTMGYLDYGQLTDKGRNIYTFSAKVYNESENNSTLTAVMKMTQGKGDIEYGKKSFPIKAGEAKDIAFIQKPEKSSSGTVTIAVIDEKGNLRYFRESREITMDGTNPLQFSSLLSEEALPGIRWLEKERIRGCTCAIRANPLPLMDTSKIKILEQRKAAHRTIDLLGENFIRILADKGEMLSFSFMPNNGVPAFKNSLYSVFAPDGKLIAEEQVAQGENKSIRIPAEEAGLYLVWINSGPASGNSCRLHIDNERWMLDGRGKGAYLGNISSISNMVRDLALSGVNTILLASWNWDVDFSTDEGIDKWLDLLRPWAEAAGRYKIRLIPYVGWGCGIYDVKAAGNYRKNISLRQIDGPRPCPLSQEYWEASFMRRATAVAEFSKKYPCIAGIGLDPEAYYFCTWYNDEYKKRGLTSPGWSSTTFMSHDECFCDHCFSGFLASQNLPPPSIEATGKARFGWLKSHSLDKVYYDYLENEIFKLTRDIESRLHKIRPDFLIMVMLLGMNDIWWCRGVSRGLGTAQVPVLDFDESVYYAPGYTSESEANVNRFKKWGAYVVHGGAILPGMHQPYDPGYLSAHLYRFAVLDGGYWFWAGNSCLWQNPDVLKGDYALAGYQEDYWKSIITANNEIKNKLRMGNNYRSDLEKLKKPIPTGKGRHPNENWTNKTFYSIWIGPETELEFYVPSGVKTLTLKFGGRGEAMSCPVRISSPKHSMTLQCNMSEEKGENICIDISPDETDTFWSIKNETAAKKSTSCYIGFRIEGTSPFFKARSK